MAKVGIIMGSDSDLDIMGKAADILEELGIDYEMTIISEHRMPDIFYDYATTAEEKGIKVIIAGAGGAAQGRGRERADRAGGLGHVGQPRVCGPELSVHRGGRGRQQHDRPGHAGAVHLHLRQELCKL